jgi:hypothetical protein
MQHEHQAKQLLHIHEGIDISKEYSEFISHLSKDQDKAQEVSRSLEQ